MLKYETLSKEIEERILTDRAKNTLPQFGFDEKNVIRRNSERDQASLLRPAFIRDIDKIMHSPYYNRYADKTQVFSFYKNDDLTRRGLHVQLVSRVARTIGKALNLNLDLIEAIALLLHCFGKRFYAILDLSFIILLSILSITDEATPLNHVIKSTAKHISVGNDR